MQVSTLVGPARTDAQSSHIRLLIMFTIYFPRVGHIYIYPASLYMRSWVRPLSLRRDSAPSHLQHFYSFPLLLSTASLSFLMTSPGSDAPNTALPATMTLAPASAAWSIVFSDKPPSTSMCISGYFFRSAETLGSSEAMKDWPPKPGSTVITRTICIR
jgi:hypothetical protein